MADRAKLRGVHTDALKGCLYVWGYSTASALGGDFSTTSPAWRLSSPTQIGSETNWRIFLSFGDAGAGIRNGQLFMWGYNNPYGQVGDGTRVDRISPVAIGSAADWSFAGEGGYGANHSLGIRNGKLYSWGYNFAGSLGIGLNGATANRSSPVQVGSGIGWTFACGFGGNGTSLAIRNGRLYAFGSSSVGQLGDGTRTAKSSPVQIGAATDWSIIAAASDAHCHGIRSGALFSWGICDSGEGGVGTNLRYSSPVQVGSATDWTAIAAGSQHCLGLRGGKLYVWGYNDSGQLGLGDVTNRNSPVQVGSASDWTDIAAGGSFSIGIRAGKLYAWGSGNLGCTGQAGTPFDSYNLSSPVQIGSFSDWKIVRAGNTCVHALR